MFKRKLVTILLLASTTHVYAEAMIRPLMTDGRAKVVEFGPDQIYALKTHYLISTDIIFGEDETVSDVNLGDASSWDVQAGHNHLYIKAKRLDAAGNLNVTTNKYSYHFMLSVSAAPVIGKVPTLFLKFKYPPHDDEKKWASQMVTLPSDICTGPTKYNAQYSFTGNAEQAPIKACDDGIFTYFQFRGHIDLPAIFMVLSDQKEEVVNYRMQSGYMVVERIAKAFTLRNGNTVTNVYNDKYIGDWKNVANK